MTSQTTLIASPSAAGRHMRVSTVTCAMDDAWRKSSRHRMSQETVTGRFPSLPPGRRRLAAAGWSKELRAIEVSRCQTSDGTLISLILGGKIPDTASMKCGCVLEEESEDDFTCHECTNDEQLQVATDDTYEPDYASAYVIPKKESEYEVRSTLMVDEGRFGVSAVMFDKYEELIWMGNQGGHVTSYYGPRMQRYTSFQIHESEEVRDMITLEHGIHVLTKTTLRHQIRRGIPKHTHRSDNMEDMQCLLQINGSRVLIGGHQKKLIDLDLNQMTETVFELEQEDCVVLKNGGGALAACGSVSGLVTLRDPRAPTRPVHTLRAHSACLSDLDMQGDLLITCGFSHSVGGVTVAEPYVSVWDVRCLREGSATRLYTPAPPLLLHFLPAVSGRAAAVAGDGQVAMLDLNAATDAQLHSHFQVDTHSSLCSVMDVSSSSQALVFGDQAGHLHLFSPRHNTEPVFNSFSRDTEFADPVEGVPFVSFTNTNFQYSSIPLPPLTTGAKYFNELPEEFFKKTYRKPKPIDPEVLKTMKMQGPIGHAPNPKTFRRNQMPYIDDNLEDLTSPKPLDTKTNIPIPKHYQKARKAAVYYRVLQRCSSGGIVASLLPQFFNNCWKNHTDCISLLTGAKPLLYPSRKKGSRQIDVRYNKNGENDTEVENYNKTDFPGLEATLPNSYCNPMLQVLYYTLPIKDVLLTHTCAKEFCLSCQLGFLFRTLDESGGAACNASDFLRAFRTVPEAAALGLILPDRGECRVDLVSLIQYCLSRSISFQIEIVTFFYVGKRRVLFYWNESSTHTHAYTYTHHAHARTQTPTETLKHVRAHIRIHAQTRTHTRTHSRARTHAHAHTHATHTHTLKHAQIHAPTHTYTRTHIYTHKSARARAHTSTQIHTAMYTHPHHNIQTDFTGACHIGYVDDLPKF
ncbi:PAN2-PAN3 deadenylation complex catalytic subunit PAN2 [Eumeta japonica]|uniref:PAN2-PAN3 deadenylation complex catalytic subunit PAN2 n=1 Tax=Eumeta variegata TaxID=151549 RepID=A0A4C1UXA4_EUMVA|nr:PAN2-PAN3 deadenylation complex catalytic subunit PAN2 [Eumeta japonica]